MPICGRILSEKSKPFTLIIGDSKKKKFLMIRGVRMLRNKFSKSFYALFFTEFWERFSYYGMQAILLFYMYFSVSEGGLGFSETTAVSIVSIYGALVYLLGVLGGYVSDRFLGSYKSVLFGGVLIMFGHVFLSLLDGLSGLFLGLLLIVLGSGLLKPNIPKMVGELYERQDHLRDSAFSLYYFGVNLGAFIAPLLTGWFGLKYNFHYGFGLAAIGMFIGLITFYFIGSYKDNKAPDRNTEFKCTKIVYMFFAFGFILVLMSYFNCLNIDNIILVISLIIMVLPIYLFYSILSSKKLTKKEYSSVLYYIPLFIAAVIFWEIEELSNVIFLMFANTNVELYWVPVSWIASINPLFILLLTPIFVYLWLKLGNKQPSTSKKFFYSLIFAGIGLLVMLIPLLSEGLNVKISVVWLLLSYFLVVVAELLISPIGLSATYKSAPGLFKSRLMALWNISDSVGQAINSQIVKYFIGNEIMFFMVLGLIPIIFAVIFYVFIPKIDSTRLKN
ncbi:MAG: proton-dependent oligopeptide transporter, POT family [Methanobrevibacter sp. CfCl-M3]